MGLERAELSLGVSEGRPPLFLPACLPWGQRWLPPRGTVPPGCPMGAVSAVGSCPLTTRKSQGALQGGGTAGHSCPGHRALLSAWHTDPCAEPLGTPWPSQHCSYRHQRKCAAARRGNLTTNTSYFPRSPPQRSRLPGGVLDCIPSWEWIDMLLFCVSLNPNGY